MKNGKNNKRVQNEIQRNRIIFIGSVIISFVAFYIYNILTPLMSDDLLFDKSLYHSIADIFIQEYQQYMNWNGRSVLQVILKVFSLLPKSFFNVCISICYVVTLLLIYWNIRGRKAYDSFLYVLINVLVWNYAVDFSQTMLWMGGACNYLWGIMIILGFITIYRKLLEKQEIKNKSLIAVGMFLFGVLAGWGNENTSGGAILIILLFTTIYYYNTRKLEKWMVSGIGGMIVGFLFMFLAPGNKVRGNIMRAGETYSGISALISRGVKVFEAINKYLFIYIAVIVLLGVYFYYRKYKLEEFKEVGIFTLASIATAGVLIFTPEPMPRAYFGANIYMMIAAVQMVQLIREEDTVLITLKSGGIILATIAMMFIYVEEGANLVRILREVNEREEYILEQVKLENYDLKLPMIRPQFETKYSFMYENDISDKEDWWINEVYCIYYGLNSVEAVAREEYVLY
ncbi:MAG: hypothetical protein IKL49_11685 [Lachnospiraceae bacterium]|nr:hypothetical protein [Lachnospiraceae bacterium]